MDLTPQFGQYYLLTKESLCIVELLVIPNFLSPLNITVADSTWLRWLYIHIFCQRRNIVDFDYRYRMYNLGYYIYISLRHQRLIVITDKNKRINDLSIKLDAHSSVFFNFL